MKKQLTHLFSALCLLFFFSSCEHDIQEETGSTNNSASALLQGVTQKTTSLDELKNDPYLSTIFNKALKNIKQNKEIYKRSDQETTYGLNLADEVKKYTLDETEYTSYTIPIINDNGDSYIFQNLVIEKDLLRDAAYLITYYPDDNYRESVRKGLVHSNDNIDFTGSKLIQYLYYKRKVNVINNTTQSRTGEALVEIDIEEPITICVETYTPRNCTAGGNHTPGESCTGNANQLAGWDVNISCTTMPEEPTGPIGPDGPSCPNCGTSTGSNGGGSPFFPDNTPSPDWTPKFMCVKTDPRTGECTKVIPYTPIITDAMDPYNYYLVIFSRDEIDTLLSYQYREIRGVIDAFLAANRLPTGGYTTETIQQVRAIMDFLGNHIIDGFIDEEALNFAKEAINAFKKGSEVDFTYRIIVDKSLKDNPCLNGVYEKLGKAPAFQNYLKIFDGNFSVANLKLSVDNQFKANNVSSDWDAMAITTTPENYMIEITLNNDPALSSRISNYPQIVTALVFIHEMIHAEIYRKLLSCANLPNVNYTSMTDVQWSNHLKNLQNNFPGLYDYFIRYQVNTSNPTGFQHQAMAQHYRNTIKEALKAYDNNQHADNFYDAISWIGLKGTTGWDNLTPDQKAAINSTIQTSYQNETYCN
jgi:hypothetical protein